MLSLRMGQYVAITLWAVVLVWLAFLSNGELFGIDDADIFFTYAENLAGGNGLTYASQIPKVEGYTSTLWMLLSALMFFLNLNEQGIIVLSVIFFTMAQIIALNIIDYSISKDKFFYKLIYIVIISFSFSYISWTTITLMDSGLWSLILISITHFMIFNPSKVSFWLIALLVFALAPLARPEAYFLIPIFLLIMLIYRKNLKLSLIPVFYLFLGFLVSVLFLTFFRYYYFGFIFPNTFYAKVSPSFYYNFIEGLVYFSTFIYANALVIIVLPAVALFAASFIKNLLSVWSKKVLIVEIPSYQMVTGIISTIVLAYLLIPLLTGGDHFALHRLYQPIYPLMVVIFVLLVHKFLPFFFESNSVMKLRQNNLLFLGYFLVVSFLVGILSTQFNWINVRIFGSPIAHEFQISRGGRDLGIALNQQFVTFDQRPAIGVITAGGISRTYKGPIFDLMGLNNSFIAHYPGDRYGIKNHSAFSKEAFFELPIDLLINSPDEGFTQVVLKGLDVDSRFIKQWAYGYFSLDGDVSTHEGFYNELYVKTFENNGHVFFETKIFDSDNQKWVKATSFK